MAIKVFTSLQQDAPPTPVAVGDSAEAIASRSALDRGGAAVMAVA